MRRIFNRVINHFLYKTHHLGLSISILLAWVTYKLSEESIVNIRHAFNIQEKSRALMRSNLLLSRSFGISSAAVSMNNPDLMSKSIELFEASQNNFKESIVLSKNLETKYEDPLNQLYNEVTLLTQDFVKGKKITKGQFSLLAKDYEDLVVNMANDEILLWGQILETNAKILNQQEESNSILKVIHGVFTVAIFLLMYFSYRKREADLKIYESEQLHRMLFTSLSEGVMLVDSKGKISNYNNSVTKILNTKDKSLIGSSLLDLFYYCIREDKTPCPADENPFALALSDPSIQRGVVVGVFKKNYTFFWLSVNTQPVIDFHDRDKHSTIISFSDISERIAKQKIIDDQKQHLVNTARLTELGEMAGGIAHEVNNPLAVISAEAEDLIDVIEDEGKIENEEVVTSAEKIIKTSKRIAKIVKGLLTFSREGDGDEFEEVEVKTLLGDVLDLCQRKMESRKIKLIIGQYREGLSIECRSVPIGQVLMNLLNNGADAIEKIEKKWIEVTVNEQKDMVVFWVTDCGHGIPKDIQNKILQPFFTTKEVGKGTGLGLSISKGIVESHGGEFFIDNDCPNTRFVVKLPKVQAKNKENKKAA